MNCQDCDAPLGDDAYDDHSAAGFMCWRRRHGDVCHRPPIDWRERCLAAEATVEHLLLVGRHNLASDMRRKAILADAVDLVAAERDAALAELHEKTAFVEMVQRDFSGPARPTHHRCRHCVIAAGNTERAWITAVQYSDAEIEEHAASCPNDPAVIIVGALRDKLTDLKALLTVARAEAGGLRQWMAQLDAENTALVEQLFTQATGRDIDAGFCESANAGAAWQAQRAEAAEARLASMRTRIGAILAGDGERMGADLERLLADIPTLAGAPGVAARDAAPDACQDRIAGLLIRRDELLALVAKLSQTMPLASELAGGESQRAAMLAEIGTLRSRIADLQRHYDEARENAPRALIDALADITCIAGERDQARRQNATLQATVLGLLAVRTFDPAHVEVLRGLLEECERWMAHEESSTLRARAAALRDVLGEENAQQLERLPLEPACPGPDCPMCSGAMCNLCGAGCWNSAAPYCTHAGDERHREPPRGGAADV